MTMLWMGAGRPLLLLGVFLGTLLSLAATALLMAASWLQTYRTQKGPQDRLLFQSLSNKPTLPPQPSPPLGPSRAPSDPPGTRGRQTSETSSRNSEDQEEGWEGGQDQGQGQGRDQEPACTSPNEAMEEAQMLIAARLRRRSLSCSNIPGASGTIYLSPTAADAMHNALAWNLRGKIGMPLTDACVSAISAAISRSSSGGHFFLSDLNLRQKKFAFWAKGIGLGIQN